MQSSPTLKIICAASLFSCSPACGDDSDPAGGTDSATDTAASGIPTASSQGASASGQSTNASAAGSDSDNGPDSSGDDSSDGSDDDSSDTSDDDSSDTSDPPPSASCGDVELTHWEQKMLWEHNRWRDSVEPPAADMLRVYWDVEIARNAADWVSSCDPDWPHSPEEERSGIGGYEVFGENLSYCGGSACDGDPDITDGSGTAISQGWWDERNDYNWEADQSNGGIVSHYTQMVSANIYAIGCATQFCGAPGPGGWDGDWWWTICQYGPRGHGYWQGTKPYEAGSGGLVEPPAGVFDTHEGLCGP